MTDEVSLARLRAKRAFRTGRIIGFIQSIVILLILVVMSEEYDHNQFFQAWAGARIGVFAFFLNGVLAAFYAGLVIAYYLSRPIEKQEESFLRKKKEVLLEAEGMN